MITTVESERQPDVLRTLMRPWQEEAVVPRVRRKLTFWQTLQKFIFDYNRY